MEDLKGWEPAFWLAWKKYRLAYAFVLPALIAIGLVILYPLFSVVVTSFERYHLLEILTKGPTYIGFANYVEILKDPEFWYSLGITMYFTAACDSDHFGRFGGGAFVKLGVPRA